MGIQKYSVSPVSIGNILNFISLGEIAVPEIQRPFVWSASKVRDLIDSLYQGYPVGYLITWRNPDVRLKDGTTSSGKRVLIDGQQRVTALMTALMGIKVINKEYKKGRITISFNPIALKFEVANPAIQRDSSWIYDISSITRTETSMRKLVTSYCDNNEGCDEDQIDRRLHDLRDIVNNPIGMIELNSDLDIETVTEIFIRINSKGVVLSQSDFAMSKIASNETYGGDVLRKCIDYFCHLAVAPEFYSILVEMDPDFTQTDYFQKMAWLKAENDDIYDPSYTDMLRVSFTSEFKRGRLADLVALLSGRNFEMRTYEESIAEESFTRLKSGIIKFMNETNFKRFVMIIKSAGFIDSSMIRSQNVLNFAYIVYLVLKSQNTDRVLIEKMVRRWLVMSILTGRYSGSPESRFDQDIRRIAEAGIEIYLQEIETGELSEAFWSAALPQQMNTSVASSPYFKVYLAAQVKTNDKGFLSRDITVRDLITHRGDVHHLFPKNYLKKNGLQRGKYNQIANYVMMQSEINIAIKDRAPGEYFSELITHCNDGKAAYGAITETKEMSENFAMHCIPDGMQDKDINHYEGFLQQRRKLMARKVQNYYETL